MLSQQLKDLEENGLVHVGNNIIKFHPKLSTL